MILRGHMFAAYQFHQLNGIFMTAFSGKEVEDQPVPVLLRAG